MAVSERRTAQPPPSVRPPKTGSEECAKSSHHCPNVVFTTPCEGPYVDYPTGWWFHVDNVRSGCNDVRPLLPSAVWEEGCPDSQGEGQSAPEAGRHRRARSLEPRGGRNRTEEVQGPNPGRPSAARPRTPGFRLPPISRAAGAIARSPASTPSLEAHSGAKKEAAERCATRPPLCSR